MFSVRFHIILMWTEVFIGVFDYFCSQVTHLRVMDIAVLSSSYWESFTVKWIFMLHTYFNGKVVECNIVYIKEDYKLFTTQFAML
jgi:hypothetical protein